MPIHNIGKATLQRKLEKDEKLDLGTKERKRRLKSEKHVKVSKESKKKGSSYYESSHYTNSYPFYQMPVSLPTYGSRPAAQPVQYYSKPTSKPVPSYYDPLELSEYESYSDMIDYYYLNHKDDSNSIDEPIGPSPISPVLPPVKRPGMDSPIWSYSEDETTELPSMVPTGLPSFEPSISPSPSMGQCMVSVMLDQCSSLLQLIEPKEGCDCYNFCGGLYLGCCGIGDPCPLTCEVMGGFVAGCRFEYTSTPNPSETEVPSISPSRTITEEPTLSGTAAPTSGTSRDAPEPSPTPKPSTLSPTKQIRPPGEDTAMPTTDILSVSLESFTLEYEVTFSRQIAQSDLVVLTSITNSYLQVYMSGAFQSDSTIMADFVTEYNSFLEDPESSVVLVTFKSTGFFDPRSEDLPSRIDLERELQTAFQGVALAGYLGRVQALPASNAFSKTTEIFMVQNPPIVSRLESREFSRVAAATAIFAVAIVTSLAAFSWYRTRRRRRRFEASDKFLQKTSEIDSIEECNIISSNDEDIGFKRSEKRLSMTLLQEIDRIEDMRRGFEDQSKDLRLVDHEDSISQRSGFESDESDLYEDDTIDDEEDDSIHDVHSGTFH